jgi:hypothetical protein
MTGISLHMQWLLTSQSHGNVFQREQMFFFVTNLTPRPYSTRSLPAQLASIFLLSSFRFTAHINSGYEPARCGFLLYARSSFTPSMCHGLHWHPIITRQRFLKIHFQLSFNCQLIVQNFILAKKIFG